MASILKDRSFLIAIILTAVFLSSGMVFLYTGIADYALVIFALLPVTVGMAIGALPNRKLAYAGMFVMLVIVLLSLAAFGFEGWVCVLMSLPIVVPLMFIGGIIMHFYKKCRNKPSEKLRIVVLPMIVLLFGSPLEKLLTKNKTKVIAVRSEIVLPYSAMETYEAIKSVDTVMGDKPFLLKIDLPVPEKCVLEKEAVGGLRTCYFSGGKIVEKITLLEKGKVLKMDVIKYELTGRKWLGFKEAIYLFDSIGPNKCKMTRITTYTSELKPRFYWVKMERVAIEQEHAYVFQDLVRRMKK
jgi:hypothetical protein